MNGGLHGYLTVEPDDLSPLALAHVGDAVYDLLVRTELASRGRLRADSLHKETVAIVNARAQHKAAELLAPHLTDEETAVFRRARNAKVHSVPKNAELSDYHGATGLEALFGWLWLNRREERIRELFDIIMENADNGD
jgi:ribonuclease-3 family protein